MTPVYEVNTKHTRKVLEDFINFTYKVKYPRVTQNLVIMSICFAGFAYLVRGSAGMYVFAILALALFSFAMLRKKISFAKLAQADPNYQKQSEIHLIFGESEFRIENKEVQQEQRFRYPEVSFIYADDFYYYLSINNEDLQVIPKSDFVLGNYKEFYDFISEKTDKPILPTSIPWKVRIQMMKEYRDVQAEARNKRQEEQKQAKKKKK